MKKIVTGFTILIILSQFSCIDEVSVSDLSKEFSGKIVLESSPDSADIFLLGTDINKITPDSITNLEPGDYNVCLKKDGYFDTSFIVTVPGKSITLKSIVLESINAFIFLDSNPDGAEIFIGGRTTGKFTPDSLTVLKKGKCFITLKKEGYLDTAFSINASKGGRIEKNIILEESKLGNMFVNSHPEGAKILLSENNTGQVTPDTILNLTEGLYNLTLKLEGYRDTSFRANVVRNKTTDVDIALTSSNEFINAVLSYTIDQFDQIIFNFHLDQDIELDQVEVLKPGSTEVSIFNFNNSLISAGDERIIIFTEALEGTWTFTFYGSVTVFGINSDFIITTKIDVD